MRAGGSAACARSGGDCGERGLTPPAAGWSRRWRTRVFRGIIRGKPHKTPIPDKNRTCPCDKVTRQFMVPAQDTLRVSDFTCFATWAGLVSVKRIAWTNGATALTFRH